MFELGAPRHYVRLTSVLRRQVLLEPQRIRSSCVGRQRGLVPHARSMLLQPAPAAPPAAPPGLVQFWKKARFLRAALAVLLDGLTLRAALAVLLDGLT